MSVGLPYARAEIMTTGEYALVCPLCGCLCVGDDTTQLNAEDRATKGAAVAYARHYGRKHQGEQL